MKIKSKNMFLSFLSILIATGMLASTSLADTPHWDVNWNFRKQIAITNNVSTTLYNYSMMATLDTAGLISQGKMQSDCGDIRIIENGVEINYGIKNPNSASTEIYFIANDLIVGGNNDIYIYYGNPDADNGFVENWKDAFYIWWDDFDTDRGWYDAWGRGGYYTVSGGYLTVYFSPYTDVAYCPADGSSFPMDNVPGLKTEAKMKVLNCRSCQGQIVLGGCDGGWGLGSFQLIHLSCGHQDFSVGYSDRLYHPVTANTWYASEFVYNRLTGDWHGKLKNESGVELESVAGNRPALESDEFSTIIVSGCNNNNPRVDYIYLRYFIEPEPDYTLGEEEYGTEPAGPVAYWSFDDTGDPGHDDSGNGHNGTVYGGVTSISGMCGNALDFDGVNGYVNFGNTVGNFGTDDFSVVFWMRTNTSREETVMGKRVFCGVHSFFELNMSVPVAPPGKMFVEVYESSNNNNSFDSIQCLDDDNWHQVAIIRKGFDVYLYVNGGLDASDNTGQIANIDNSASFILGKGPCVPAIADVFNFSGELDEVRIYDRELSASEIEDLYNACQPVNIAPIANAGGPYVAQATSWSGALIGLDGTGSSDPDGDTITYAWDLDLSVDSDSDGDPNNDVDSTEPTLSRLFPIGQTEISLVVTDEYGVRSQADVTKVTVSFIEVDVDIKPGSFPNAINLGSHGVIPVAFLTDEDFDASTIDPATVTLRGEDFADGMVKLRGKKDAPVPMSNLKDVDDDGDLDLVVHLETEKLAEYELEAICELGALTYDGYVVSGSDTIQIVPQ